MSQRAVLTEKLSGLLCFLHFGYFGVRCTSNSHVQIIIELAVDIIKKTSEEYRIIKRYLIRYFTYIESIDYISKLVYYNIY